MDAPDASGAAGIEKDRERDYIQFFVDLGINDEQKGVFLAGLLRNYHIAAAKLDKHLVGYSADVRAAVSRLAPASSVHDTPEHLWSRVHDRLAFFHDEDRHAQRVGNVGMAFAYRHFERNSLASANAQVLHDLSKKAASADAIVEVVSAGTTPGVFVAPGALVIGSNNPPPDSAQKGEGSSAGGQGPAAGNGGGSELGKVNVNAEPDGDDGPAQIDKGASGESRTVVIGDTPGRGPPSDVKAAAGGRGEGLAPVNKVAGVSTVTGVTRTGGSSASGKANSTLVVPMPTSGSQELHVVRVAPINLLRTTQPRIYPTGEPLAAVKLVLSTIADREDIDDAARELMTDSVLFYARNSSSRRTVQAALSGGFMETSAESWAGLVDILEGWWARWEAPPGVKMMAPPGTTTAIRNCGRCARKSRWCYSVNMSEVNEVLQGIGRQHSRYFKKAELPEYESVERIVEKDALPLTRCVAVMLPLGTLDSEYVRMLVQLASTGRGEHTKNAHISSATCQAFVSPGLGGAVRPIALNVQPSAAADAASDLDDAAAPLDVDFFFAQDREPTDKQYADVARAGALHASVAAQEVRAVRKGKRQRQSRAVPALPPRQPSPSVPKNPPTSPTADESSDEYLLSDTFPSSPDLSPPAKVLRSGESAGGPSSESVGWTSPPSAPQEPTPSSP